MNDIRNVANTPPVIIKLASEGLFTLPVEEISTRMNQIWHINQQAQSSEQKPPLCLPMMRTMVQVITTLNHKHIYIKIANEVRCNCTNLGFMPNNMNSKERNTIICETQSLSNNREIN